MKAWHSPTKSLAILVLSAAALTRADDKFNELRKRRMDLDNLLNKCNAMTEPDKSDCLAKRQKKVDKYKADLAAYQSEVQADRARNAGARADAGDVQTRMRERDASIKNFIDYVNTCTEKSERCASALFQVANLTFQNEEDAFLIKQQKYEDDYKRWEDRDRKGSEPVAPKRNHTSSMKFYERFLKEYPNNKDTPKALVQAGYISGLLGNDDREYEYLNLLVTRFPDDPLAIPAHLHLGEYWLLKRKYAKAIAEYEKVPLNFPGNEASLALYHRAEAYYNLADFENAAKWYFEYVDRADHGKLTKADLRDEALDFMAASWADMDNGFEVAQRFLESKGDPAWENDVYFTIGRKNREHDRLDESVKAFRFLLQRDPTYPKAPIADMNIVEILVINKKAEEAQQARMDLVERYAPNSEWFQKNSGNKAAFDEAQKAIKLAMYQIPLYYHAKGMEGKGDPEMLKKAEFHYRAFLNRYSDEQSWDIYQVHQSLAILYGKLNDFDHAAEEWQWCANANTNKFGKLPQDKKDLVSREQAAYNVVVTLDQARQAALADRYGKDQGKAYDGPETDRYFQAVQKYMAAYGKSNDAPDIAFNAAFVDYEAKHYDKAIRSLSALLKDFPNHKDTPRIRRALAQSYLESNQYDEAERQYTALVRSTSRSDKSYPELRKALASTIYKQAEAKAKDGNHGASAQKYAQLAKDFRDVEDIADKALFEAGGQYDSAGKTEDGVQALLQIYQRYPKSKLKVTAILRAASMYMNRKKYRNAGETFLLVQRNFPQDSLGFQSVGWAADAYEKAPDLRMAAATYESAYRLYPKNEKTPAYLYNAGQTYEQAKDYESARRVYKLLGDEYPKSSYAVEAVFSVPLLLEKEGDHARAAEAYEAFVKKYENDKNKLIRAHLGAGKNYEMMGNEAKAIAHYQACVAIQKKDGEKFAIPAAIAAEAAFHAGDIHYKKITRIHLDGSKSQNERKLAEMMKEVSPSVSFFAASAQMAEEEWALRSYLRLGDLFSSLARATVNQRITGSREEQVGARAHNLMEAQGFYDKAKELYQKNLDLGKAQVIESPWLDSTGARYLDAYLQKGEGLEEVSKLLAQAPLPKGAGKAEREQLAQASKETMEKVAPVYKEGLRSAQYYSLDNEPKRRMVARLRQLDANAEELSLVPEPKPAKPAANPDVQAVPATAPAGAAAMPVADLRDSKYDNNMKRIDKIYQNQSLTTAQKIELLQQMQNDAQREMNDMRSEDQGQASGGGSGSGAVTPVNLP